MPKAINTHSKYVVFIAFPLQQWLKERAWMLCYTYIACIVITETEIVYCSVRTEPLNKFHTIISFTVYFARYVKYYAILLQRVMKMWPGFTRKA
jgi:hypothetical protein